MKPAYYKYPTRFSPRQLNEYLEMEKEESDYIPFVITYEVDEIEELSVDTTLFDKWLLTQTVTRRIDFTVIHCTATIQTAKVASIINYWKNELGWTAPGYHIIIKPNGEYSILANLNDVTNGVYGYNKNSIHISYIGGIDSSGRSLDNRTKQQKGTIEYMVSKIQDLYPSQIKGHRDFKGVKKDCPSFDVSKEF